MSFIGLRLIRRRLLRKKKCKVKTICCRNTVKNLIKKLDKNSLKELKKSISFKNCETKCITISRPPNIRQEVICQKKLPHVISCHFWRWPDLQSHHELKAIEGCRFAFNFSRNEFCVNPYHYLLVETPALPTIYAPRNVEKRFDKLSPLKDTLPYNIEITHALENHNFQLTDVPPPYAPSPTCVPRNVGEEISETDKDCFAPETSAFPLRLEDRNLGTPPPHYFRDDQDSQVQKDSENKDAALISSPSAPQDSVENHALSPIYGPRNVGELTSELPKGDIVPETLEFPLELENRNLPLTGTPPPPYASEDPNSREKKGLENKDAALTSSSSPCHDVTPITYEESATWCSIRYYELNQRVGVPFEASQPFLTVDGLSDALSTNVLSTSARFCLDALKNINRNDAVVKTRGEIGYGVRFCYIGGEVIAECLSRNSIFVQSLNCNQIYGWPTENPTVFKIPSGYSLKIFSNLVFAKLLNRAVEQGYEAVTQLTHMCTIRMSFVKGWGEKYRRQTIFSTHCSIELHLNGPLQWLDSVLKQMSVSTS